MIEVVRLRTIYKMTILGIVRDVGHTYLNLNPFGKRGSNRSIQHIGDFNAWWRCVKSDRPPAAGGKRKKPSKHGFYDFLVKFLNDRGRTKWTRTNSPEIVFKKIESDEMNGHQSGELEDKWIKHHAATTLNVVPGGNKGGKKRKYGHGTTFGCVAYHKTRKVFIASWTPEHGKLKQIPGSRSTNINYTYQCLIKKYNEVKDQECFKDCKPKTLKQYMEHLGSKYGIVFDCNFNLTVL